MALAVAAVTCDVSHIAGKSHRWPPQRGGNLSGKREAPIHYGPPPYPKPQALVGSSFVMHHTPSMSYGTPSSNYGSPSSSYGSPSSNYGSSSSSDNSIHGSFGTKFLGSGKSFGGHGLSFGKGPRPSFGGFSSGGQKGFGSFKSGPHGFSGGNSLSGHSFGSGPKGFGGGSFPSGGIKSGGHNFGGGNLFSSGFKGPSFGSGFGGNLKGGNFGNFGGDLKNGFSFGGSSFPSGGFSFGPNFGGNSGFGGSLKGGNSHGFSLPPSGGNHGGPPQVVHMQVMNNPFVTGIGLSGNYDKRTLSLGDSFSGAGNGYEIGSLGNGQSTSFDFSGKGFEKDSSASSGAQKLHTMVSFSNLEPHTPSQGYGSPSQSSESYGAPEDSGSSSFNVGHFGGSQKAISSVMIQTGDKQGPVMFYGSSPTSDSLSGTYFTMANNPSNSYGVPMYAQNSDSQSHQPSFSIGGHTNQLFSSYSTGGGRSQHNFEPESSYGTPQTSYSHQEESSGSYGAPTASASTSYETPSVSYGPNTRIPFKPSPFLGATSPLSYKESHRDLNGYSSQVSQRYEVAGGSSYDAPVYNTISYSTPLTLQNQYAQSH